LVLMLNDAARQHGVVLTNEQLAMDLKGKRFFGTYEVEDQNIFGDRVKLMLGFCNSYNKSLRVRICFGGKVFVCSNLAFHAWADEDTGIVGEVGHRHTINVNEGLWGRLDAGLSQIDGFRMKQERFYDTLVNAKLDRDAAFALIMRAGQAGILNKSKLLDVADEWKNQERYPDTHDEYQREWHPEFRDRNAFNLLNACTQVEKTRLKKNPVTSNMDTLSLSNFFHKEFIKN